MKSRIRKICHRKAISYWSLLRELDINAIQFVELLVGNLSVRTLVLVANYLDVEVVELIEMR